jgi:hypothetical protein
VNGRQKSEPSRDSRVAVAFAGALLLLAAGCSSRKLVSGMVLLDAGADAGPDATFDGTADVGGDNGADAAGDTNADTGGSQINCGGGLTCDEGDLCVTMTWCGGPVNCLDVPDSGECPGGSTLNPSCPSGRPGCVPECPAPTFKCASRPAACGATINCFCAREVCAPSSCFLAGGTGVTCANQ